MDATGFDRLTHSLSTRLARRTLTGALGLGALATPVLVAAKKKGKRKRKCKKPQTCSRRSACGCNDDSCSYLPHTDSLLEGEQACAEHCTNRGGWRSWGRTFDGAAAVCTTFGEVRLVDCPLV